MGDVTFIFCIDMRLLNDALALVHGQMDGWTDTQTLLIILTSQTLYWAYNKEWLKFVL